MEGDEMENIEESPRYKRAGKNAVIGICVFLCSAVPCCLTTVGISYQITLGSNTGIPIWVYVLLGVLIILSVVGSVIALSSFAEQEHLSSAQDWGLIN